MSITSAGFQIRYMPGFDAVTREGLERLYAETDANELARKQPHEIILDIHEALPGADSLEVSMQLLEKLRNLGFGVSAPKQTEPQRVIVELPKSLNELAIGVLLEMLASGEGDTTEVLTALKAKGDVIAAIAKTDGKIVVPTTDGKIAPAATAVYIADLAPQFSEPQRKVDGRFPITLEQALGLVRMVTFNPITFKINYVGMKDMFGVVISNLPDMRYYALVWALLTDHPRMPRTTDEDEIEGYLEEIFAPEDKLRRRWQRIFEDFAEARSRGDIETQALIRQMTEDQAAQLLARLGDSTSSGPARPGSPAVRKDWESIVRAHFAQLEELRNMSEVVTGYNRTVLGTFSNLTIAAYNVQVDALVLNDARITKYNVSGVIYMPPRRSVLDTGYNNLVQVINLTWEDFAKRLGIA